MALGRYLPRAPTDPDVPALEHPVPRPTASPSTWSPKLFDRLTLTCVRTSMCSTCFPRSILLADASLSSTGSSRASSPASTVLSKRYDILPPSRRTSFPSLGDTSDALVVFALCQTSALAKPGVGNPVSPTGNCRGAKVGLSQVPGEPQLSVCHVPIRLRQDCLRQTIATQQRGPWYAKSRGSHERSFGAQ